LKDGRELEPEGMTSDVRRWCKAKTEPFGQSRVDLEDQPVGHPLVGLRRVRSGGEGGDA
jgi:hypothetical protein